MATDKYIGPSLGSDDWYDVNNWNNGVPSDDDVVDIPANSGDVELTDNSANLAKVDIGSGSTLTVDDDDVLVVTSSAAGASQQVDVESGARLVLNGAPLDLDPTTGVFAQSLVVDGAISGAGYLQIGEFSPGQITGQGKITAGVDDGVFIFGSIDPSSKITLAIDPLGYLELDSDETLASITLDADETLGVGGAVFGAASLTFTDAEVVAGEILLNSGSSLTDKAGITLDAGAVLAGSGYVTTGNTATTELSGSGTVMAANGRLEVVESFDDSALQLEVGPIGVLVLDGVDVAPSVTFAFPSYADEVLEVSAGGSLTLTEALAIGDEYLGLAGTGAQLDDAAGVTLAGGLILGTGSLGADTSLTGYGYVFAPLIAGSGAITASGDDETLYLDDVVHARPLAIDGSLGPVTLYIGDHATSSAPISMTDDDQTLEIVGSLKIQGGVEHVTGGAIELYNGVLTDKSGIVLDIGGALTGFGQVITGNSSFSGGGAVTALGLLAFDDAVDPKGSDVTNFIIDSYAALAFDDAVGSRDGFANVTFADGGSDEYLWLSPTAAAYVKAFDLALSDAIFTALDDHLVKGVGSDDHELLVESGASGDTTVLDRIDLGSASAVDDAFDASDDNFYSTGEIVSGAYCFMPGTLIRTPEGEVAVETLKRGDLVLMFGGGAAPVSWLGLQTISRRFADPLRVLPIRIRAGALGVDVPSRDLRLSPDHAVLIGSALFQAGALINGTSIVRETDVPPVFTYYHVEIDHHSLILAEGAASETFVDNVDRLAFDNWAEHAALYPGGKEMEELSYPRAKSHRQVPIQVREMLAERAAAIGAVGKTARAA